MVPYKVFGGAEHFCFYDYGLYLAPLRLQRLPKVPYLVTDKFAGQVMNYVQGAEYTVFGGAEQLCFYEVTLYLAPLRLQRHSMAYFLALDMFSGLESMF